MRKLLFMIAIVLLPTLSNFAREAEDSLTTDSTAISEEDSIAAVMDTLDIEQLYKNAAKWEVGNARKTVKAAREELIERGEEALDYIFFEKYAYTGGLEDRATKATIKALLDEAEWRIYDCLGDNPRGYLATSARYIGNFKLEDGYDSLLAMLEDTTEDRRKIRNTVIRAIGDFGNPDAAPKLHQFLEDTLEYTRITAAVALGKLKNPKSIEHLIEHLDDSLFTVRQAITLALPKFGKDALKRLDKRYKNTYNEKIKLECIRIISRFNDDDLRKKVFRILRRKSRSDDRRLKGHALLGMKKLRPDKVDRKFRKEIEKENDPFIKWVLEMEK
ncbi:MAG: HEAT repeat domain-containing protein [Candidatus Zixiibacteriota bacterium]